MKFSPLLTASLLYRQSYRVLNKVVSEVLEQYQITPLEWAFLSAIQHSDAITVTELAKVLSVETPMITQITSQEKIQMYIIIKKSKDDKRIRTLNVNAKAKRLLDKIEKNLDETLAIFFKDISQKDIQAHLKVLAYIVNKE